MNGMNMNESSGNEGMNMNRGLDVVCFVQNIPCKKVCVSGYNQ